VNILTEVDALPRSSALTLAGHILRARRATIEDLAGSLGVTPAGVAKAIRRADRRFLERGRPDPIHNVIGGVRCPAVHAKPRGALYRWHDGAAWVEGDEPPAAILNALPESELARLDRHSFTRTGRYLLPVAAGAFHG
jgi:hypothetical protein